MIINNGNMMDMKDVVRSQSILYSPLRATPAMNPLTISIRNRISVQKTYCNFCNDHRHLSDLSILYRLFYYLFYI